VITLNEIDEIFTIKKEILGKLFLDGFISAHYSHKTLFESVFSKEHSHKLQVSLAYLNQAHTYFVNAEIYLSENISVFGERDELEDLIHRFSVFNKEVLDNVRTDHSHQWSDIEFRNFVDSFKTAASLLSIDKDSFWVKLALKEE
jgi:hypothetical protein